jgi:hypothetical protein
MDQNPLTIALTRHISGEYYEPQSQQKESDESDLWMKYVLNKSPGPDYGSPSPVRMYSSPAMYNTHRDQILRCLQALESHKNNLASADSREAVCEALEVFLNYFSCISSLDGHLQEARQLQEMLRSHYPIVENLKGSVQCFINILSRNLNDTPVSPKAVSYAQSKLEAIGESEH